MDQLISALEALNLGPWPTAGLLVLGSILAAKLVELLVTRVLLRMTARTNTMLDDDAIRILRRPLFLTVLLIGLRWALSTVGAPDRVESITASLLFTVGILVWIGASFGLANVLLNPSSARMASSGILHARTLPLFNNMVKIVALVAGAYWIIMAWHIDPTAWLASAGIAGIAIGFAAKDTLANIFSGVFILADAPYKVGDYINLDAGERGEVVHIGLRSTRILTRDDIEVTIPNAVIGNAKIVNETGGRWPRTRVRIPVGVAYGSDIDRVRAALSAVAAGSEHVCPDPEAKVRFLSFGNSSLDFELHVWIEEPSLRGLVLDALNTAIYKRFAADGIQIPFPQRDVHIKTTSAPPV